MPNQQNVSRGEIWLADLNPVRGHEQVGRRPVLVVSVDLFNQSQADLVVIIPLTSTLRLIPFHVTVLPPEGGLTNPSALLCEAVRSISKDRLLTRWGIVSTTTMAKVEDRLRILLQL
jgi:mRNA interferase MazF